MERVIRPPGLGAGDRLRRSGGVLLALLLLGSQPAEAQEKLNVVATLPTFAAIAREVTGDLANVEAIARGDQDPHFVNPRPSYAALVGDADVFIATGLDLELWVPSLIDRAGNAKIVEGGPGNVVAYSGVTLLQVPENVSRTGGDVHIYGNPHIHTDPINAILIARNILETLEEVDRHNTATYEANARDFEGRIMNRLFGEELVALLGAETLFQLARGYKFWDFVNSQEYQGKPLTAYLGGWLAQAAPFRNRQMACYHKNWAYFSARFRIACAIYVEPKPGIPATPGHVQKVITFIQEEEIAVLLAANYFSRSQVERVASRTDAAPLVVAEHVAGAEGVDDYFALIDLWVSSLSEAFDATTTK